MAGSKATNKERKVPLYDKWYLRPMDNAKRSRSNAR
jgi:hypothetical protein